MDGWSTRNVLTFVNTTAIAYTQNSAFLPGSWHHAIVVLFTNVRTLRVDGWMGGKKRGGIGKMGKWPDLCHAMLMLQVESIMAWSFSYSTLGHPLGGGVGDVE